jgi:hypothetical protein
MAREHTFVIGTTGSGKSANLLQHIENGIKKNQPVVIINGKADNEQFGIKQITNKLCEKYRYNFLLMDQNTSKITLDNKPLNLAYSPFMSANETTIKDILLSMSIWSEDYYKSLVAEYWQEMAGVIIKGGLTPTFELLTELSNPAELNELVKSTRLKDKLSDQDKKQLKKITTGEYAKHTLSASSRFTTIARGVNKNLFIGEKYFNFTQLIKNNKRTVILVELDFFNYDDTAETLGRLAIADIKLLVNNLQSDNGALFVFDEISVYMSEKFIPLLNQTRSKGIKCILATQSLADIDRIKETLTKQIIDNVNAGIIFRINEPTAAEYLANILGTREVVEQTQRTQNNQNTGESSNRNVEKYYIHPNIIKTLSVNTGIYYNKMKPFNNENPRLITNQFVKV